jgi:hypothetical protein
MVYKYEGVECFLDYIIVFGSIEEGDKGERMVNF